MDEKMCRRKNKYEKMRDEKNAGRKIDGRNFQTKKCLPKIRQTKTDSYMLVLRRFLRERSENDVHLNYWWRLDIRTADSGARGFVPLALQI